MHSLASEIGVRILLLLFFIYLESGEPFYREIQPEEQWLYKNPHRPDTFSAGVTVFLATVVPPMVMGVCCAVQGLGAKDFVPSIMCSSLSFLVTVILNNMIKILVGRPRPDFLHRCFPNGIELPIPTQESGSLRLECSGDAYLLKDGRKSFPSGHSALSCSAFFLLSIYLIGQLGILLPRGRGHAWRTCTAMAPSLLALMICLSRYSDYRHHWQDVLAGAALGCTVAWLVYHQYFPPFTHQHCHRPLAALNGGTLPSGSSYDNLAAIGRAKPVQEV